MANISAVGVLGVGMYVPEQVRKNDWWPEATRRRFEERVSSDVTTPEVFVGRAKTPEQKIQFQHMLETYRDPFRGSKERRILDEALPPSAMEIRAAQAALKNAGIDPEELSLIVGSSSPTDQYMPPNGGIIQAALGAKRAHALGVDTGCASFISGLAVADAMIRAGYGKYALVFASSTYSRITDFEDPFSMNFGDGAGAFVLGPVAQGTGIQGHAVRGYGELHSGICVAPKHDKPWYQEGGHFYLHSKNLKAGQGIVLGSADYAKEAVDAVLRTSQLTPREITHFYSHQPVNWFNAACRNASGLGHCATTDTFREYAGMGSANVPVNVSSANAAGQLAPGANVLLYTCGAGFLWEAMVIRWTAGATA